MPELIEAGRTSAATLSAGPTAAGWIDGEAEDALFRLRRGLDEFRVSHSDSVISAGRTITPLLDLWSLATAVDHAAAAPIEALLRVLVVRTTTTATELSACIDNVEAVLTHFSCPRDQTLA